MLVRVQGFERTFIEFHETIQIVLFRKRACHLNIFHFDLSHEFPSAIFRQQQNTVLIINVHGRMMATDEAETFYTAVYDVVRLIPQGQVTTYGRFPSSKIDKKATLPN